MKEVSKDIVCIFEIIHDCDTIYQNIEDNKVLYNKNYYSSYINVVIKPPRTEDCQPTMVATSNHFRFQQDKD